MNAKISEMSERLAQFDKETKESFKETERYHAMLAANISDEVEKTRVVIEQEKGKEKRKRKRKRIN